MNGKRLVSDFWISDREADLRLGGLPAPMQRELLDELRATRARLRELETLVCATASPHSRHTAGEVAALASAALDPVLPQGTMMRSVWVAQIVSAVDRAVHDGCRAAGLVGDHPGVRLEAKLLIFRERADVRAAVWLEG